MTWQVNESLVCIKKIYMRSYM